MQSHFQSLCGLESLPDPSKVRIEYGIVGLLLGSPAENNWNACEGFFMRVCKKSEWRWSEGDDEVRPAIPILISVPLTELLLGSWIWKQGRFEIFGIQLDLVRCSL